MDNANIYLSQCEISVKNVFAERKNRISTNYERNQKYHWCLNGKLAVTCEGYVKPCPMIHDVLLDLKSDSFNTLF